MRRADLQKAFVALLVVIQVSAAGAAFAAFTSNQSQTQLVSSGTLAAPTGLTATQGPCVAQNYNIVNLSWTATPSLFADGYEIFRATAAGGPYTSLGTVAGRTTTTYQDQQSLWNTTFYYQVKATRNLWRSPVSNTASITTLKRNCN